MPLNLDYFYGGESEQYSFYRIPKVLFTAAHYRAVLVEAKVLYGLLLDRMALSARNGWLDEGRRVFIYFTLEDAMVDQDGAVFLLALSRADGAPVDPEARLESNTMNFDLLLDGERPPFMGKSLEELTPELMRVAEHAAGSAYGLISLVVSFAIEVLDSLEHGPVYTAGASHILDHPEYRDVDKAQKLMSYLNEEQSLANVLDLPALSEDNTKILIGPENVADELKDTSVVLASYDIGDGMKGVIGVVGPTRMDYAKVAAKLSYVADGLSKLFGGQGGLPPAIGEKEE